MRENRWLQFDVFIVVAAAALALLGVAMIHSATCGSPCPGVWPLSSWAVRQGVTVLGGFLIFGVVMLVDYRLYRVYAYHIYAFALALLVLVLIVGRGGADDDYGSRRWIYLGFFDLQVSEVAKVAVMIGLARLLGEQPDGPLGLRPLAASLAMVAVPAGLVFIEPDLGSALAFVFIWLVMIGIVGLRPKHALGLLALGLASLPVAWLAMRDYMRERVVTFLGTLVDVEHAAFDEGYNVLQARISIGSGGFFGRGYLEGTQTQLDYLRIKHSDFIFSAYAEELGFVGALVLFALFMLLIFRVTRAGERSRDRFGRLVAYGVAAMFLFQAAANLGANVTLLPVTGIPLPFVSYGRTSLLTSLIALGIVESVLLHRLKYRY